MEVYTEVESWWKKKEKERKKQRKRERERKKIYILFSIFKAYSTITAYKTFAISIKITNIHLHIY